MGVSFLMKNVKATATFPSSITNGPRIVDFYVSEYVVLRHCSFTSHRWDPAYTFPALRSTTQQSRFTVNEFINGNPSALRND